MEIRQHPLITTVYWNQPLTKKKEEHKPKGKETKVERHYGILGKQLKIITMLGKFNSKSL